MVDRGADDRKRADVNRNLQHPIFSRSARAITRGGAADTARRRMVGAVLLLAALALAFGALRDAHAGNGTYKWTDERGVVHYADKMPADAVNRATSEMNSQGMVYKRTEAAPTPEQLRAKYGDAEKQRQAQREQRGRRAARQCARRVVLEGGGHRARPYAFAGDDRQPASVRAGLRRAADQAAAGLLEKKIAAGSKGAPPAVERELESIDRELAKTNEFIDVKKKESLAVGAKYDADKHRWRELVEMAKAEAAREKLNAIPGAQVGGPPSTVMPTGAGAR